MIQLKKKKSSAKRKKVKVAQTPLRCRCGGEPTKPKPIKHCDNRWVIKCQIEKCFAYNVGQGLADTIQGWNRLSTHFYR